MVRTTCFYCGQEIRSKAHRELCLSWKKAVRAQHDKVSQIDVEKVPRVRSACNNKEQDILLQKMRVRGSK